MEVSKKLTIPEIFGMVAGGISVVLFCVSMFTKVEANADAIVKHESSISLLNDRYNTTELFKGEQKSYNMNQDKFNERIEKVLLDNSKTTAELTQAVVKLQVFLDQNVRPKR